jgi:Ca2+/H+ antiporter
MYFIFAKQMCGFLGCDSVKFLKWISTLTLKMESIFVSEILVCTYKAALYYSLEGHEYHIVCLDFAGKTKRVPANMFLQNGMINFAYIDRFKSE